MNSLEGKYITAEDVGTSPEDMEFILKETDTLAACRGRSGDPSPHTARGVFRAMQAAAKHKWGSDDLAGKTVAIQGCGHVGYFLAGELARVGAKLIATDVDPAKVKHVVDDHDATAVTPEEIYSVDADIFAPCALGGVLNDQTIPQTESNFSCGRSQQSTVGAAPWRSSTASRRALRARLCGKCRRRDQWLLPRDAGMGCAENAGKDRRDLWHDVENICPR